MDLSPGLPTATPPNPGLSGELVSLSVLIIIVFLAGYTSGISKVFVPILTKQSPARIALHKPSLYLSHFYLACDFPRKRNILPLAVSDLLITFLTVASPQLHQDQDSWCEFRDGKFFPEELGARQMQGKCRDWGEVEL